MIKRLLRRPAVRGWLVALLGRYLRWALATTRWHIAGATHLSPYVHDRPVIAAFWHERLPLMPALWTHVRDQGSRIPMHVLVSRHRDGQVIGDVMRGFGVAVVHGSTMRGGQDRGGAASVRRLLDILAAGGHVAITPDGPRGPRREAAPGVAQLAAMSGVAVLPCAAQIRPRRVLLSSWDRMVLPLPFGRGVLACGPPISVPPDGAEAALPAIAQAMTDAADLADRLLA